MRRRLQSFRQRLALSANSPRPLRELQRMFHRPRLPRRRLCARASEPAVSLEINSLTMNRLFQRSSRHEEALTNLRSAICDLRIARRLARKSQFVNRKLLGLLAILLSAFASVAEQRFPPPDFTETNHQVPGASTP